MDRICATDPDGPPVVAECPACGGVEVRWLVDVLVHDGQVVGVEMLCPDDHALLLSVADRG